MEQIEPKSILQSLADMAEFINGVAALVCGHLRILQEGGFDPDLAQQMAAAVHSQLLGLTQNWDEEENTHTLEFLIGREDEEDE